MLTSFGLQLPLSERTNGLAGNYPYCLHVPITAQKHTRLLCPYRVRYCAIKCAIRNTDTSSFHLRKQLLILIYRGTSIRVCRLGKVRPRLDNFRL